MTFDMIEDAPPRRLARGRVQTPDDAEFVILMARRIIMAEPHNPAVADALLGATAFISGRTFKPPRAEFGREGRS